MICFKSSQLKLSSLFTEIKSSDRNTPFTPSTDRIFLISSLLVLLISVISIGPIKDTFFPGMNFNEFGFGVVCVWTNMIMNISIRLDF